MKPMKPTRQVESLHIDNDRVVGKEGGFVAIRRLDMRNRRTDGSLSEPYLCDFIVRPFGVDAVVVAVFHRHDDQVSVLVREQLRPAMALGRRAEKPPIPDAKEYLFFTELVAGIIETDDVGEAGLRRRAALEVHEEAGYRVGDEDVILLGAGTFPSPGLLTEKFWLTAVPIEDPAAQESLPGDGSPLEEGASTRWIELDEAIAACTRGDIEDLKTEVTLRRLRDYLR
jgi:ADP-ribose pyrophosphatase